MADSIDTIGHSTHSVGRLVELLTLHGITAVADVRSHPYSRFNPQFNREVFREALKATGIAYVFLGRELGARTEDKSCYREGRVQYDLLARTALFQAGLTRLVEGASSHRIALLCAEKDPLTCHRGILICRHLELRGVRTRHILEQGQLESHDECLSRLLDELNLSEPNLYRDREEAIAEAYARRGRQIAHSENRPSTREPTRKVHL